MSFVIIIPARFSSRRLPGKPLIDINGKPMIIHVLERALEAGAERVIVAVDHKDVANVVESAGGEICMTHTNHKSGIERLAEVIEKYKFGDEQIIVNMQGDEPTIPVIIIRKLVENIVKHPVSMVTLATPILCAEEAFNPNIVKVVIDAKGYALYFSRATIPWDRNRFSISKKTIGNAFLRHLGVYSYRAKFIRHYVSLVPSAIEHLEMLEQLRALWYGEKIYVTVTKKMVSIGVDTLEDLKKIRSFLR